jgi:hypothetical protein
MVFSNKIPDAEPSIFVKRGFSFWQEKRSDKKNKVRRMRILNGYKKQ